MQTIRGRGRGGGTGRSVLLLAEQDLLHRRAHREGRLSVGCRGRLGSCLKAPGVDTVLLRPQKAASSQPDYDPCQQPALSLSWVLDLSQDKGEWQVAT